MNPLVNKRMDIVSILQAWRDDDIGYDEAIDAIIKLAEPVPPPTDEPTQFVANAIFCPECNHAHANGKCPKKGNEG